MKKIGAVIQQLRIERKMSRSELAILVHLSYTTIWNLENGFSDFTCNQLRRFAAIFGYNLWALTTDETNDEPLQKGEINMLISKIEDADLLIEQLKETIIKLERSRS